MAVKFPSPEWLQTLFEKLNSDERYAQIARNWEGDMCVVIEPSGPLTEKQFYYLDLWHGKCRKVEILKDLTSVQPKFILKATYDNISRIMKGELDPMQAMMTGKLKLQGNMAMVMKNVRAAKELVESCTRIDTAYPV
jgi:putative sterol carrier protein